MKDQKCRLSATTLTIFILGLICILSIFPANTAIAVADSGGSLSTYIIQVRKPTDKHFATSEDLDALYRSFLPTTATSSNQEQRMVHSYRHVVSGFAAKLTAEEAKDIRNRDGVFGEGLPPPPAKWKGKCIFNDTSCNNKLIGARSFAYGGIYPPTDDVGHGTHTASTAAGAFVKNASALGNAKGTAAGIAPLAHLAIYQVCGISGCLEADILAGLDAAIEDGVDVISLSVGGDSYPFFQDAIATGSFAAIQKGIFVSSSAGNMGPYNYSLSNEAPWLLNVGASTIDRRIKATARLGNGKEFDGETVYQPQDFDSTLLPLVDPARNGENSSAFCFPGSLKDRSDLKGKVVVCSVGSGVARVDKGQEVKDAGGAAMILVNSPLEGATTLADKHVLPAVHVGYDAGREIKSYLSTTSAPKATILLKGTDIGSSVAPVVASFSSRGPNYQSQGILKPDIIGPGVNILAAWPVSLDNSTDDKHSFNVISGTSMSCPHLSGVAALLKSAHPDWSPAAIKSAIITTASTSDTKGQPILDQLLTRVSFTTSNRKITFLTSLIVKEKITCSSTGRIPDYQLNYPSISLSFESSVTKFNVTRRVRNVGPANSSYKVVTDPITGLNSIGVYPSNLEFTKVNETASFSVDFTRNKTATPPLAQGAITWVSAKHSVRIPVAVVF
ncbi:hypothetical protein EUGRSUZ_E01266 [Eucalyptus grandis]|uniref:Uncharacterized protein n=2 Tax=Eucalyptus grandis TaxID=71139 RepID=A0ACC3KU66_EUCGR|nr:hypothetical protein EUGRSUZ_E01266 [Eucalyptus grandis]